MLLSFLEEKHYGNHLFPWDLVLVFQYFKGVVRLKETAEFAKDGSYVPDKAKWFITYAENTKLPVVHLYLRKNVAKAIF